MDIDEKLFDYEGEIARTYQSMDIQAFVRALRKYKRLVAESVRADMKKRVLDAVKWYD